MADDGQEQEEMVAEPHDYSRWAMTCLWGCVGISLICLSFFVLDKSVDRDAVAMTVRHRSSVAFALGFGFLLLGGQVFGIFCILLLEWYTGNFNPGGQMTVDKLLSL